MNKDKKAREIDHTIDLDSIGKKDIEIEKFKNEIEKIKNSSDIRVEDEEYFNEELKYITRSFSKSDFKDIKKNKKIKKRVKQKETKNTQISLTYDNRLLIYAGLITVIIIILLMFLPIFRNITINVNGMNYYSNEEIYEKIPYDESSNWWFVSRTRIKRNINKLDQINSVQVQKKFPNEINITVSDMYPIFYVQEKNSYEVYYSDGSKEKNEYAPQVPILINFTPEMIEKLESEILKIDYDIITLISSIEYTPNEIDSSHMDVYMNDGMVISINIDNFNELNYYPEMIGIINQYYGIGTLGIIYLDKGDYFELISEGN